MTLTYNNDLFITSNDVNDHWSLEYNYLLLFLDYCRSILGNSYLINHKDVNSLIWTPIGIANIISNNENIYQYPLAIIDTPDFYFLNLSLKYRLNYDRFLIVPTTLLGYWIYKEYILLEPTA